MLLSSLNFVQRYLVLTFIYLPNNLRKDLSEASICSDVLLSSQMFWKVHN